eukprot:4503709-Heterocapsa_arctica.AAC.1
MEQVGAEEWDRRGSDPEDDRSRGREVSRARNRHHLETINAMEEEAKKAQRRLRELETIVKLQDDQM